MKSDGIVPITVTEQITPAWLTGVLRRRGHLDQGYVTAVHSSSSTPFSSIAVHLQISYSADAPQSAPGRLFLKFSNSDLEAEIPERGRREIDFYQAIAEMQADLPVPYCYDAVFGDDTETFHLLLEDLSETHFELEPPLPPLQAQCEQLVDVLARIHAYWWDHPRLGLTIGKLPTPESERAIILENAFPAFVDFLDTRLPGQRRKIYEDVMAAWPTLMKRLTTHTNLALCHGDAHCWNFMYPLRESDTVRLIDWEALGVSLGTDDLAYMMALFWYPEHRAQVEHALLRRYHQHLQSNGVGDYDWDDCWFDYRLSVMRKLFEPVWWWSTKHPAHIWWDRLERVILAFQDLDCAELLG